MKNKISLGVSDDYAIIDTVGETPYDTDGTKLQFYYGYEFITEDDQWCFVARKNGEVLQQYTQTEIESYVRKERELTEVSDYLIVGMYMYFNNIKIEK